RVAQKGEAAGPTPIATRSAPFGATSLVDTTGALAQAARSSVARRQFARRFICETAKPMSRGILARKTSLRTCLSICAGTHATKRLLMAGGTDRIEKKELLRAPRDRVFCAIATCRISDRR